MIYPIAVITRTETGTGTETGVKNGTGTEPSLKQCHVSPFKTEGITLSSLLKLSWFSSVKTYLPEINLARDAL